MYQKGIVLIPTEIIRYIILFELQLPQNDIKDYKKNASNRHKHITILPEKAFAHKSLI